MWWLLVVWCLSAPRNPTLNAASPNALQLTRLPQCDVMSFLAAAGLGVLPVVATAGLWLGVLRRSAFLPPDPAKI
jgi:hypothetical protein